VFTVGLGAPSRWTTACEGGGGLADGEGGCGGKCQVHVPALPNPLRTDLTSNSFFAALNLFACWSRWSCPSRPAARAFPSSSDTDRAPPASDRRRKSAAAAEDRPVIILLSVVVSAPNMWLAEMVASAQRPVFACPQPLGGRLGVTVRFTVADVVSRRCALPIIFTLCRGSTVGKESFFERMCNTPDRAISNIAINWRESSTSR